MKIFRLPIDKLKICDIIGDKEVRELKIKKFDNIWVMGLILCGVILISLYVLKIFFPSFVVETAQSEKICEIGKYIDTHKWAWYTASSILSFIVMSLLCCCACRKKTLNWKELVIIAADITFMYIVKAFLPKYYTAFNYISMILLPCIMQAKLLPTTITFVSLILVQTFTLEVRNIGLMITDCNFATSLILVIDVYMFQILLYLAMNYKREEM